MNENLQMTTELFGKSLSRLKEMVVLGVAHIKIGRGLGKMINEDPAIYHVAPAFWSKELSPSARPECIVRIVRTGSRSRTRPIAKPRVGTIFSGGLACIENSRRRR